MVEMHKHLDLGIPHSNLYVLTLCIDGVRKCWDLGIPYLRDLFLMTFYTRRVSKQWDPSIVDYGKLIGNTFWLVGLRKHTRLFSMGSSLQQFVMVSYMLLDGLMFFVQGVKLTSM